MKKNDLQELRKNDREWKKSLREWDKWWGGLKKMARRHSKSAVDWLLFFQPKDNWDKGFHIVEVISVYAVLFRALGLW